MARNSSCEPAFAQAALLVALGYYQKDAERRLGLPGQALARHILKRGHDWGRDLERASQALQRDGHGSFPIIDFPRWKAALLVEMGYSHDEADAELGYPKRNLRTHASKQKKSWLAYRKAAREIIALLDRTEDRRGCPLFVRQRVDKGLELVAKEGLRLSEASARIGQSRGYLTRVAGQHEQYFLHRCDELGIPDPRHSLAGPSKSVLRDARRALELVRDEHLKMVDACERVGRPRTFLAMLGQRFPDIREQLCDELGIELGAGSKAKRLLPQAALIYEAGVRSLAQIARQLHIQADALRSAVRQNPERWEECRKRARSPQLLNIPEGCHLDRTRLLRNGRPVDGRGAKSTGRGPGFAVDVLPTWNKKTGELRFRGQLARKVDRRARNGRRVVTEFEDLGWPDEIEDPLPRINEGDRVTRLQETVRSLNQNLRFIRFHSVDGRIIRWEPVSR